MRILMFGRGVIATVYGHALQSAGHDVEFYVRPGRAAEYGDHVRMNLVDARRVPLGKSVAVTVSTRLRESLDPADGFDLVVLSVGHHRLAEAAEFLAPRIGDATVLVFGNLWDDPLAAVAPIPGAQVVVGFPQAGGGFDDDGVLNAAQFRSVILAATSTPNARERAVRSAFRGAGFTIREQVDMRGWLAVHFASNVGMYAEGVRHGGLAGLIGNRRRLRDALLTAREFLPVLEARGTDLRHHRSSTLAFRLPNPTAAAMAFATARLRIAQVSLEANSDPNAAESRAILRDALHEARRLGVPTPRLEAAGEDGSQQA